ncbi:Crp/Fnr family transcriptional regulator [Allomuricauda sp. F6463D]|uniref:Crp/Fnr family transcriptional regulator n=1 Tax=Allomuricauda sp. F6463D TaxID=2926409 RepID=UPI001FF0F6A2|nr:Crp/Fnr family transcriptional regulator [Muricauda sp. F6463D]MCK0161288.1 Crp/Fnr family transcriptional regulator [Muricauda sp. F6463D]
MDNEEFYHLKTFFFNLDLTKEEEEHFYSLWTIKTFNQYDLITEAGSTERFFYVVLEGVQALYVLNEKGEKVILGFSYSGSPSGVFDSFIQQKPSQTFIEALKPSKLFSISRSDYDTLFDDFPNFYKWGNEFFQQVLFGRLEREVELLTLTADQRYKSFMQRCPDELKVIPQKYLASYLNMKPETFSRLRKSILY